MSMETSQRWFHGHSSDYVDFVRRSGGPILLILDKLDQAARHAAWTEMAEKLNAFQTSSGWEGPNELLLTVGTR